MSSQTIGLKSSGSKLEPWLVLDFIRVLVSSTSGNSRSPKRTCGLSIRSVLFTIKFFWLEDFEDRPIHCLFEEAVELSDVITELPLEESTDETSAVLSVAVTSRARVSSCNLVFAVVGKVGGAIRARALLHFRAKLITVTKPLIMKKVSTASVVLSSAWRKREEQDNSARAKRLSVIPLFRCREFS